MPLERFHGPYLHRCDLPKWRERRKLGITYRDIWRCAVCRQEWRRNGDEHGDWWEKVSKCSTP